MYLIDVLQMFFIHLTFKIDFNARKTNALIN